MNRNQRARVRPGIVVSAALTIIGMQGGRAVAHPFEGIGPTCRWPNNTRINIYIPEHPTDANVNDDVRTGIERWAPKMSPYGITFTITMAAPPNPLPANSVVVSYPTRVQGAQSNEGYGTCEDDTDNITGGTIEIERDNASGAFVRNLAQHEMGHVLGLADDATADGEAHNAMDHDVPSTGAMGFSPRDDREIQSVYGAPPAGNAQGNIEGQSNSIGPEQWEYSYNVQWTGGPEIPTLEVDLGCHPTQVNVTQIPPGWVLNYPPQVLDGVRLPAVTADTPKLHFYAAVPQAALRASNPFGQFRIVSNLPPGPGRAHALIQGTGGQTWTLFPVPAPTAGPAAIPTVGEWGMVILCLSLFIAAAVVARMGRRGVRSPITAQGGGSETGGRAG